MIKLQGLACREAFNNLVWDFNPVITKGSLNISAGIPYPEAHWEHLRRCCILEWPLGFPLLDNFQLLNPLSYLGKKERNKNKNKRTAMLKKSVCLISVLLVPDYQKTIHKPINCLQMDCTIFPAIFTGSKVHHKQLHSILLNLVIEKKILS